MSVVKCFVCKFNCTCLIHKYMLNATISTFVENHHQILPEGVELFQQNSQGIVSQDFGPMLLLNAMNNSLFNGHIRVHKVSIAVSQTAPDVPEVEKMIHESNADHFKPMVSFGDMKNSYYVARFELTTGYFVKIEIHCEIMQWWP